MQKKKKKSFAELISYSHSSAASPNGRNIVTFTNMHYIV